MRARIGAGAAALAALVALGARLDPAAANAEGPAPGFTGGFGEPTCSACHFDSPAEPDAGELVLEGVPARYEPGAEYPLRIVVRDPRLARAGFQLAARFAEGGALGRQAGHLAAGGPRVEIVADADPPVLYARQTLAGAEPVAAHEAVWALRWTAPSDRAGAVAFHAAANAANDDDSELGDVVHVATARSEPRR